MRSLVVLVLVLAGCNGYLLWHLNRKTPGVQYSRQAPLVHLAGEEIKGERPFTLYLFYDGKSGCSCLDDWPQWESIHQEFDEVAVKGIHSDGDQAVFLSFSQGMGLTFPLNHDPGRTLVSELKVPQGSVSKVLIGPNGEILYMDTHQTSIEDHRYFKERLRPNERSQRTGWRAFF